MVMLPMFEIAWVTTDQPQKRIIPRIIWSSIGSNQY